MNSEPASPPPKDVMIRFAGIEKWFGDRLVLNGLDLDIRRGETLVILGRSGVGKSVALKILLKLIKQDGGQIWVDGEETTEYDEEKMMPVRRKIGMLFQGSALFDSFTVGQNVAYSLAEEETYPPEEIARRVREKLSFVSLEGTEDMMPSALSGGMQKRVALARAMASEPTIMLYDEPTTGLDPLTAQTIDRLIRKVQVETGVTSIVVTHEIIHAIQFADRMAILRDGTIKALGTTEEMMNSKDPYVSAFLQAGMGREVSPDEL